jgi:L-threonylcarbamoyladenylate synthase
VTSADSAAIDRAVEVLRNGGLVAIPTETVYGLAADATNEAAVRQVFSVKGRPADHPVIVHAVSGDAAMTWAAGVPEVARRLAVACWPGPLTLLLPRADHVLDVVTGSRPSVGVRVPAHPVTTELLRRFGGAVVAPSANRFGKVSPTTADHVRDDLGTDVDVILDGGPCAVGVESTIVDCCITPLQVLRPGAISAEEVASIIDGPANEAGGPSRASGMLTAHYQPDCSVLLADSPTHAARLIAEHPNAMLLDETDDLVRYARVLYERLREADRQGRAVVVALLPPPRGIGHAVRDRLFKAAAFANG